MEFSAGEEFSVQTFLAGNEEQKFAEKIEKYFKNIEQYLPWILKGKYVIRTENTFPHSSGIASSASGFGAIAKCLMQLDAAFQEVYRKKYHWKKPRFWQDWEAEVHAVVCTMDSWYGEIQKK